MKKLLLIIIVVIVTFILFGCNNESNKINNENLDNADDAIISYGVTSYAANVTDDDMLRKLLDQFRNLSFEPTDQKMDTSTMLNVIFYHNEKKIALFGVDENGVFLLDGETGFYKVSFGTFNYEFVKNIYLRIKEN